MTRETFRYRARPAHALRPALVDVYRPDGPGPHPSALLVHGGGFVGGHRRMKAIATLAEALPRAGFLTVAFDYRVFLRGGGLAEAIEDMVAADRWWRERAVRWGADPTRMSVVGVSAGALVATAGARRLGPIHKFVGVYGPYDLTALPGRTEGIKRRVVLGTGRLDRARDASTCNTFDLPVPVCLLHGTRDGIVPFEHSMSLARFRRERGLPVEVHLYDGVGHGFLRHPQWPVTQRAVADVLEFLRREG